MLNALATGRTKAALTYDVRYWKRTRVAVIERFARDDATLNQPGAIDEALARKIRLPATLLEANDSSTPATRPPSVPAQSDHVTKLEAKANGLHTAIRALASLGPNDFTGAQPQLSRASGAMVIHDDTRDELLNRLREVVAPALPDRVTQGRGGVADLPIESPVHPLTVTAKALDRLPSQVRTVVQERAREQRWPESRFWARRQS